MKVFNKSRFFVIAAAGLLPLSSIAVTLPGSADSSRVKPFEGKSLTPGIVTPEASSRVLETQAAPEGAKNIKFTLKSVEIRGNTTFGAAQLGDLYAPFIDHVVTLDIAWVLAAQITDRYKQAGYFLARAYVPAQEINDGVVHIAVVEGYVSEVTVSGVGSQQGLVKAWVDRIKSYRPLTSRQLEQAILELNTLADVSFRAVLNPPEHTNAEDGAVNLELIGSKKSGNGLVRFDNYGSRYLGPYAMGGAYEVGLIPGQKTNLSLQISSPMRELQSAALRQTIPVAPKLSLDATANYTNATPGYLLEVQEIESSSYGGGAGVTYQWRRQRDENLSSRIGFDWRNAQSDILGTPLSRDRLRLLQISTAYDGADSWHGYNWMSANVTQGLSGFGASKAGELNLSRAEAKPDFTKLLIHGARLQQIGKGLQALASFEGQLASGSLYASEEFGYGGQSFGRAYDNSEITGDHGVSTSLELQYMAITPWMGITPLPYAYYDIGAVWNEDDSQPAKEDASSAGFGIRAVSDTGANAQLGLAFPLTRAASAPIYGHNGKAPRLLADINYTF